MAIYGYQPPDLELGAIDEHKKRQSQYNAVKQTIQQKPEIGINLEHIVNKYGNILGRDIMVGSALLGFTEDSPEISALVKRQIEIEQENSRKGFEKVKAMGRGIVRNTFVGLDSFAESFIKRPYQAAARAAIDRGKSPQLANLMWFSNFISAGNGEHVLGFLTGDSEFADAYKDARKDLGDVVAVRAIKELAKGNKINLGEGYFGNSTLARDTEIFKEIQSTIQDPSQLAAIEQVIQNQLGTPITELERDAVEKNKYRGQVISPGRVMAMNFVEPGTERYRTISGLIDGIVTLGLDPANLVGGQFVKAGKFGKMFISGEKMTGFSAAKSQGQNIYQGVNVTKGNRTYFRYVDVGDNVLSKSKYTEDELRNLAKEGGNTSFKYAKDAKGKYINKQLRKDGSKAKQKEPIVSKAIVGINKGEKGTDILIDSSALQKTILPVGPGEKLKVFGKQGIDLDYGEFDDFNDYLDFMVDHALVEQQAFAGESVKLLNETAEKVAKAKKAGPSAKEDFLKLEIQLEQEISSYVKGLRAGRVREIDQIKNASGLSKVLKPSLNKTRFEGWHATTGRKIYQFMYDQIQKGAFEYEDIMKLLPDVASHTKMKILRADSADAIGDIIANEVRAGTITKRLDPYSFTFRGGVSRRTGRAFGRAGEILDDGGKIDFSDMGDFLGVGAVIQRRARDSKMYRLFQSIAPSYITAHSRSKGFRELEQLITRIPFTSAQKARLFEDLAATSQKLDDFALSNNRVSKLRLTEEFYNLLLGSDPSATGGLLGEVSKLLTAKGYPRQFAGGVLDFIAEVKASRAYWVSLVGDEVVDIGFTGSKAKPAGQYVRDGAKAKLQMQELEGLVDSGNADKIREFIEQTYDGNLKYAQPTAHLMSEMLTGNIPLPDMNEVFRILGTFRNTLYSMTGLNKLGPKRIDLPQLLALDGRVDDITDLAKKNREYAEFIASWKKDDGVKALTDEYKRITGQTYKPKPKPEVLDIFDDLDNADFVQEAFGAGNLAANAVTKNLAKIFYKYDKDAGRLTNSVLIRLANNAISGVWKPFQLLRFAWTVRVISEEQLRMWAADLSQIYTHPISHLAYAFNRKAATDVLGNSFKESLLFKQAMSRGSDGMMIRSANSMDRYFDKIEKSKALQSGGKPRLDYAKGWATEYTLLADDDLVVEVAKILRGTSDFKTIDDLAAHLVRKTKPEDRLALAWQNWADEADGVTRNARQKMVSDKDRTLEYLESLHARIVDKLGGDYKKYILDPSTGKKIEIPKNVVFENVKDANDLPLRMYYEMTEHGQYHDNLLQGLSDKKATFLRQRRGKEIADNVDLSEAAEIFDEIAIGNLASSKDFTELVNQFSKIVDSGPQVVKVSAALTRKPGVGESYNKAVAAWFDLLMSKPTNFLSRSPAFKQFYYARVTESAYTLNARALEEVISNAKKAKADKNIIAQLEKTIPTQGGVSNLNEFDDIAKAVALQDVQELLYDLNRRSQFSQATSLIFPFAEVHKEIAGTWTRLLSENPTKLRKMQLTVDSLSKEDPNNEGDAFIYTDPLTGEEVFTIPVVDKVLNNYFQKGQFFGGEDITDDSTRMRTVGFLSSANIVAGGIIPGVGPVIQIGAQYLLPTMKENSAIYKTIFPYGVPDSASSYVIPSWLRKSLAAFKVGPESWQKLLVNTQKDLMRAKLVAGHINLQGEEALQQALQETKRQASVLTFIRSGVQGTFLTGGSFRWEKEVMPGGELYMDPEELVKSGLDPDGRYFAFNVWSTVYYTLLRENQGDSLKATEDFTKMFGYDPTALLISKSKEVRRTPYTEPGLAEANEELFKDLPDVAYYFHPDSPLDEFSYTAWIQSFEKDALGDGIARYDLTLNEWAALYNMAAGRLAMEKRRRDLSTPGSVDYIPNNRVRNEMLFRYNEVLRDFLPGYDIQPRTPGPTDLDNQVRQLRKGMVREDLQDTDTAKALQIYFQSYDNYISVLQRYAGKLQVSPKRLSAYYAREQLRQHAEELYTKYPEFYYVWNDILSKQLEESLVKLLEEGAGL